jgi:hypothetical protein
MSIILVGLIGVGECDIGVRNDYSYEEDASCCVLVV